MKIKSALLTQMSGSIGGMTGSHNSAGLYLRARTIPVNPSSAQQQVVRMYFDQTVTYWTETLTEPERESWRAYAANTPMIDKLGDPIFLSGQQQFVRSGSMYLLGGGTLATIATAPILNNTGDPGTLGLSELTSSVFIGTVAGAPAWAAEDAANLFAFISMPQNPSVNFYKGPFRLATITAGNSGTPVTAWAGNAASSNPPIVFPADTKGFVRVRAQYADGRLTQAFTMSAIAT